jgi:hypothetical protein
MIREHKKRSEASMREGKDCFDIHNDVFTKLKKEAECKKVLDI